MQESSGWDIAAEQSAQKAAQMQSQNPVRFGHDANLVEQDSQKSGDDAQAQIFSP